MQRKKRPSLFNGSLNGRCCSVFGGGIVHLSSGSLISLSFLVLVPVNFCCCCFCLSLFFVYFLWKVMQNFEFNSLNIVSLNVSGNKKKSTFFDFVNTLKQIWFFLQETHSGEADCKFWRSQWGNSVFFDHGTNHSAGVVILLRRFKGDTIELVTTNEGRWLILIVNVDNACFLLCNIYGYNSHISNRIFFSHLVSKIF